MVKERVRKQMKAREWQPEDYPYLLDAAAGFESAGAVEVASYWREVAASLKQSKDDVREVPLPLFE